MSGVKIVREYRVARTGEAGDFHSRQPSPFRCMISLPVSGSWRIARRPSTSQLVLAAESQHEAFEIVPGIAVGKALDTGIHQGGLFQQQRQ